MDDDIIIPFYGWVPFVGFQYFILAVQVLLIIFHKQINGGFDRLFLKKNKALQFIKKFLLSLPLIIIFYFDIVYQSFSLKNLGFPNKYNLYLNQLLFILGSYGLIQVLAQDSGIKTGIDQRDTVQVNLFFALMGIGVAYSVTNNRSQSVLALLLYYHLKHVVSDGVTSPVCFEDI